MQGLELAAGFVARQQVNYTRPVVEVLPPVDNVAVAAIVIGRNSFRSGCQQQHHISADFIIPCCCSRASILVSNISQSKRISIKSSVTSNYLRSMFACPRARRSTLPAACGRPPPVVVVWAVPAQQGGSSGGGAQVMPRPVRLRQHQHLLGEGGGAPLLFAQQAQAVRCQALLQ